MTYPLDEGIHDAIPAEDYHADRLCPAPSLSSSIIKAICLTSPAHAKAQHPRLTDDVAADDKEAFDIGTAAHSILLEGIDAVVVIDAKDWRTNAAKGARDAARLAGKIPLLPHVWAAVQAMTHATRAQLDAHRERPALFRAGQPEQTLIWREDDVWCRARADWLRDDHEAIDDYKTSTTANPANWTRTMFDKGFDIQAAWYLRGLSVLTGRTDARFRFVVQETAVPYALSVIALGPDAMCLAEKKVLYAIDLWGKCLAAGEWPGYPTETCFATLPPWEESRWLAREVA